MASTLAIYIYSAEDCQIQSVLAQHSQHLTAICWSKHDEGLLACAAADQSIRVYSTTTEAVVHSHKLGSTDNVTDMFWCGNNRHMLYLVHGSQLSSWLYTETKWRNVHNFGDKITCVRQSHADGNLLAVACDDGSVHLFELAGCKKRHTIRLSDTHATDLQYDPLSTSYLLVCCKSGHTTLYDVATGEQVSSLAKQPAAERMAAFVPNAAGSFVTISNKSGALQLWNVSQAQALKSMRTGQSHAQSVQFFPGSSRALLTFQDGAFMIYDVARQTVVHKTDGGHTETIFHCQFSTHDPNLLATCSYDNTVRVWDVRTGGCVKTLIGGEGILYSVAWSPDGGQLASSSRTGHVFLYDYAKGVAVKKWKLHDATSLRVCWSPTDPELLASCCNNGSVVVLSRSGDRKKVLQHQTAAASCSFSPLQPRLMATSTEAGNVYVWDIAAEEAALLQTLTGHTKRVFGSEWSPLLKSLLLSGSDDTTARVWDTDSGQCVSVLRGHAQEVRGLCWHPALPHVVFTGSWDSTIRVWDWRRGCCIWTAVDHHGDVYGLTIHPQRPFLLASASRDTTVRLWNLTELTPTLMIEALVGELPCGQPEEAVPPPPPPPPPPNAEPPLAQPNGLSVDSCSTAEVAAPVLPAYRARLCGAASADLRRQMAEAAQTYGGKLDTVSRLGLLCAFFGMPGGATMLFDLARCVEASRAGESVPSHDGAIQHWQALRGSLLSRANHLQLSVASSKGGRSSSGGIGGAKKEDVLREAAALYLQAGQLEQCCELLAQVGDWDTAISIAPAVSTAFWARLLRRRTDVLREGGASEEQLMPLLIATGQTAALGEALLSQHQHNIAANILGAQASGAYQRLATAATAATDSTASTSTAATLDRAPSTATHGRTPSGTLPPLDPLYSSSSSTSIGGFSRPAAHSGPPGDLSTSQLGCQTQPVELRPRHQSLPPILPRSAGGTAPASPSAADRSTVTSPTAGFPRALLPVQEEDPTSTSTPATASATAPRDPCATATIDAACLVRATSTAGDKLQQVDGSSLTRATSLVRQGTLTSGSKPTQTDMAALAQLSDVRRSQAEQYALQGQPVLAACCHLSVNKAEAAVEQLLLGNELELAAALAMALSTSNKAAALLMLAHRAEAAGDPATAAAIFTQLPDAQHQLQLLAARQRTGRTDLEIDQLYLSVGLRPPTFYQLAADTAAGALEAARCCLLSGQYVRAVDAALDVAGKLAAQVSCSAAELQPYQQVLTSIPPDALPPRLWISAFAMCLYSGALQALELLQLSVATYLLRSLDNWLEQNCLDFPVSAATRMLVEAQHLATARPEAACALLMALHDSPTAPEAARAEAKAKLAGFPKQPTVSARELALRLVTVTGSNLPSRPPPGFLRRSVVTGQIIKGPGFLMDDGFSAVSLSEAVMLSRVLVVSPTGSGKRMAVI